MARAPTQHSFVIGSRFGTREVTAFGNIGRGEFCILKCDLCDAEAKIFVRELVKEVEFPCNMCRVKNLKKSHGDSGSPEHRTWKNIYRRCYNKNSQDYQYYGGKGIIVCDRWSGPDGYANFLTDMGRKPFDDASIDRINTHGNYEPSNCRWTDATTQARNKTNNHLLTVDGETKTVAEWAERYGIDEASIRLRVSIGWTHKNAVTLPIQGAGWKKGRKRTSTE